MTRRLSALAALLAFTTAFTGCASTGGIAREDPNDRTYAATLDAAVQAVQRALVETRAVVTGFEQTPDQYTLFVSRENAITRSGARGNAELQAFTVRVSRVASGQARVVVSSDQATVNYGGQASQAYTRSFFEVIERRGMERVTR